MPARNNDTPRLYDDLAHLWPVLSPPEDYTTEANIIRVLIESHQPAPRNAGRSSILELGAGGGHTLSHLAPDYDVTAVDLSPAMLEQCRLLVPSAQTVLADMCDVRLGRTFDAVLAHDAIDYMQTEDDLRRAIDTAAAHLEPGGLFLVAPTYVAESFTDGESADDTNECNGLEVSFVSRVHRTSPTTFEMTMVIMAKQAGRLTIADDRHTCGLFDTATWLRLLDVGGFDATVVEESGDEGLPFRLFVAQRR